MPVITGQWALKTAKMVKKPINVDEFLDEMNHPMRKEIDWLRGLIMQAEPSLSEGVKWGAPSFASGGEDRFTFNFPPKREYIILVLHRGAKSKEVPAERVIPDPKGVLDWKTNDRALLKIDGKSDKRPEDATVMAILKGWLKATT